MCCLIRVEKINGKMNYAYWSTNAFARILSCLHMVFIKCNS